MSDTISVGMSAEDYPDAPGPAPGAAPAPAPPPLTYPVVEPRKLPDGSWTNLAPGDYERFMQGLPPEPKGPAAPPKAAQAFGPDTKAEDYPDAPTPVSAPEKPKGKGFMWNMAAGANKAISGLLGLPVDSVSSSPTQSQAHQNAIMGRPPNAGPFGVVGNNPMPEPDYGAPGSSRWIGHKMGQTGIIDDPFTVNPVDWKEGLAQGVGGAMVQLPLAGAAMRTTGPIVPLSAAPVSVPRTLGSNAAKNAGISASTDYATTPGTPAERRDAAIEAAIIGGVASPVVDLAGAGAKLAFQKGRELVAPVKSAAAERRIERFTTEPEFAGNHQVGPLSAAQSASGPDAAKVAALEEAAKNTESGRAAFGILQQRQEIAARNYLGEIEKRGTDISFRPSNSSNAVTVTEPDIAQSSTGAIEAIRKGWEASRQQARALWGVPELSELKVDHRPLIAEFDAVIKNGDPGVKMTPELDGLVNRIRDAKDPTVNQLNRVRSRLLEMLRDPDVKGDAREIAGALHDAFMNGMDKVPQLMVDGAVKDAWLAARGFTRDQKRLFGEQNVLGAIRQNSEGEAAASASTALRSFFQFKAGKREGAESLAELASHIRRLPAADAEQISEEMLRNGRQYVVDSMRQMLFGTKGVLEPEKMADFWRVNGNWMTESGLFNPEQVKAMKMFVDYLDLMSKPAQLMRGEGRKHVDAAKGTIMEKTNAGFAQIASEAAATGAAFLMHGPYAAGVTAAGSVALNRLMARSREKLQEQMVHILTDADLAKNLVRSSSDRHPTHPLVKEMVDSSRTLLRDLKAIIGTQGQQLVVDDKRPAPPPGEGQRVWPYRPPTP